MKKEDNQMRIMVLGATGMLGHVLCNVLAASERKFKISAITRFQKLSDVCTTFNNVESINGIDVENSDSLLEVFKMVKPHYVINCVGIVKQRKNSENILQVLPINTLLPHKLSNLCEIFGSRFIHISTDCVFKGLNGNYSEDDLPDAIDLYGISKHLGEVTTKNSLTLRTSIIGHEIKGSQGLVEWFMGEDISVQGYEHAIFSGLTTLELSRVIRDYVVGNKNLHGLYHVSGPSISKYDLLNLIAKVYKKKINVDINQDFKINRTLNGSKFNNATGYFPADWETMIRQMHQDKFHKD